MASFAHWFLSRGRSLVGLLGLCAGVCGCASNPPVRDGMPGIGAQPGAVAQCVNPPLLPTSGVYVVAPLDRPVPDNVFTLPGIEGIVIRASWRSLQPSAQEPNFAALDEQFAAARRFGKKVALSLEAGVNTPDWVYTLGARPYPLVFDESSGPRACQRGRLPIPWDPVYLDAWKQLIRSASRRFNRSAVLTHIKVAGLGATGQAAALPHAAAHTVANGPKVCTTPDELATWIDVGYSRQRMLQTFRELIEVYGQSFSDHRLAVIIDPEGFPAIDERGQPLPGASYDTDIVPELLKLAVTGRESRVLVQSNELTNVSTYPFPLRFSDDVAIGYQLRFAVSGDKSYRMNGGVQESPVAIFDATVRRAVAARARYLEVQVADALEPQLAASLSGARILLRRSVR